MNDDPVYRNAPRSIQFAMRFAAMVVALLILVAIAKALSWGLGTDLTDMLLVVFMGSVILREVKKDVSK